MIYFVGNLVKEIGPERTAITEIRHKIDEQLFGINGGKSSKHIKTNRYIFWPKKGSKNSTKFKYKSRKVWQHNHEDYVKVKVGGEFIYLKA